MEVSSFVRQVDKETDIKERFKEIKIKNEKLKLNTYAEYMQMRPPSQIRLMSAFDIKIRKNVGVFPTTCCTTT